MDFSAASASASDADSLSFSDLLTFCSRAQTLISQLLLLSFRIPLEFRDARYQPVLFDLRYFDSPDEFEARIEGNPEMEALEDELRESCGEFMQRFFLFANGVVSYHTQLFDYLLDLQEGAYVQFTLEKVMDNQNGRQLLTESLTLFGCLLLLLEHFMGGHLREKLLVAHVRHDRCFDSTNLDKLCLLCHVHQFSTSRVHQVQSSMILVQKPEDLFARFSFPKQVVDAIICRLRDDDLYNRVRHYPDPEHRIVALSAQGGCLYILLLFSVDFLHNNFVMREVADRFFKHCWVIPIFSHFMVDLSVSWDAYKAAKMSLSSCLSPSFIRDFSQLHCSKIKGFLVELDAVLLEGVMTKDYVLSNTQNLHSLVRNCNVSLRWLLLHTSSIDKKLRDIVISVATAHQVEGEMLFSLLLKTSQLEHVLKQFYMELLSGKESLWQKSRDGASKCILELSEFYSGSEVFEWKMKDVNLNDWFMKLSLEVRFLDHTKTATSGWKLCHMISALKEVENFLQIEENLQIRRRLFAIQKYLEEMLKALNLDHDTLLAFSVITDAAYAWEFVGCSKKMLFKLVEKNISVVLNLHSFFLKFLPALDTPLVRISQSQSVDLQSVSDYYSSEYVAWMCRTLEVLPAMLFRILNDDVMATLKLCHFPNRIERDKLQDLMQFGQQYQLGKAGNDISIIARGLETVAQSFHGALNWDMKNWLENEMRKELSMRLRNKLNSFFSSPSIELEQLEANVQIMGNFILSQLQVMELLQDLMNVQGYRIWEEEFTSILRHCSKQELHDYEWESQQNMAAKFVPLNVFSKSKTFFGHLLRHILQSSNPSCSMYIEPMSGWFDAEGHELLGLRFFDLLESCIGPVGMACLDSLLMFLIMKNLEHALRVLNSLLDTKITEELQTLDAALGSSASLPLLGCSPYKQMAEAIDTAWEPWVQCLAFIGQLQILRTHISTRLKLACKAKAGVVSFAVESMLFSVSSDGEKILRGGDNGNVKNKGNGGVEHFFEEVIKQGILCGLCPPSQTVYISKAPPLFLGRCASIMSISQLSRYVLDMHLGTLTSRLKKVALDFSPVVIGMGTFLRQFDPAYTTQYVQYMTQYIRTVMVEAFGTLFEHQKGSVDVPSEVMKSAFWLIYFCKHLGVPMSSLDSCVTHSLLSVLKS